MDQKAGQHAQTIDFLPEKALGKSDVLLAGMVALAVTLLALQFSFAHGRLVIPMAYDDITYYVDAADRVNILYTKGLGGFLKDYAHNTPHAPLSAGLATLGFLLFGIREWAPYAANSLLLFVLLLFAIRLASDLPFIHRVLLLLFVCAIPLSIMAVIEFRPDFGTALFTAMGVVWALGKPIPTADRKHLLVSGALFGCALLAKPSIFPFTLFMWGCAVAAETGCEMWEKGSIKIVKGTFYNVLLSVGAGLSIAMVYFAFGAMEIIRYVRFVMFSTKSNLWVLPGGIPAQIRYFVDGESGRQFLGHNVWLLLGITVAGTFVILIRAHRSFSIRWLALVGLTIVAYVFVTANKVKAPFFGLTFQTLLVLCSLIALRSVVALLSRNGYPKWAGTSLLGISLAGGLLLMMPLQPFCGTRGSPETNARWQMEHIASELMQLLQANCDRPDQQVFLTTTGEVSPETIQWIADKNSDFRRLHFAIGLSWESDLSLFRKSIATADLVVATDPGAAGVYDFLPSSKAAAETLRMVAESADFVEVGRVPDGAGKNYYVFKKINPNRKD